MTEWDGAEFRRGMVRQDEAARRYADEHRGRLKRGQSNGSPAMMAEHEGRALAAHYMSHDARTESPEQVLALLADMETRDPPTTGIDDIEAFKQGYFSLVREIRARVKPTPPKAEPE